MKSRKTCVYSAAHFAVDFACAFAFFSFLRGADGWARYMLLYNFCAFAMQAPLGILADRLNRNSALAAFGCLLVAAGWLTSAALPLTLLIGFGNAMFHVGGGLDVLNLSGKSSALLGVFVSPGAFGIYFGTALGKTGRVLMLLPFALALIAALIVALCRDGGRIASSNSAFSLKPKSASAIFPAICLFLVVVLRSYVGMLTDFTWKTGVWPLLLVCGTALGKASGGFLSDRLGAPKASLLSLATCAVVFLFSDNPLCGLLAVLLFNMTMPVTLHAMAELFPGAKGFSFGLLTLALFLGFLPAYLGLRGFGSGLVLAAGALLSLALLLPGVREKC